MKLRPPYFGFETWVFLIGLATVFALGAWATSAHAEIEFRGLVKTSDGFSFALIDPQRSVAAKWVAMGKEYDNFRVTAFDADRAELTLTNDQQVKHVALAEGEVQSLRTMAPDKKDDVLLSDEELAALGLYRMHEKDNPAQFPRLTHKKLGELKALNPELNFKTLKPGDIILLSKDLPDSSGK